jgi:hypothetical protein
VIDESLVTPYVTLLVERLLIVGSGSTTAIPLVSAAVEPPAAEGLVTITSYVPGANDVFGHQNLRCPLVTYTYGVLALAVLPLTVTPVRPPTVMVEPNTKFAP